MVIRKKESTRYSKQGEEGETKVQRNVWKFYHDKSGLFFAPYHVVFMTTTGEFMFSISVKERCAISRVPMGYVR